MVAPSLTGHLSAPRFPGRRAFYGAIIGLRLQVGLFSTRAPNFHARVPSVMTIGFDMPIVSAWNHKRNAFLGD